MAPARLHKQEVKDNDRFDMILTSLINYIEGYVLRHATLVLALIFVLMLALFVTLIFLLTGVSGTESGMQYNQLQNII